MYIYVLFSHNTIIQIYKCREIRNTDDSPLFRYETFINFLTQVFRHEGRESHNFYYADRTIWPNKRVAHPVAPKISVVRDLQNSMVRLQLQLSASMADKSTVFNIVHSQPPSWTGLAQSRISTNFFFKITKFSAHRFRAWCHSHSSPISYMGFLLWHLWLSYPLCESENCTQCVCTRTKSQIVQSPTKPNDKI